MATLNAPSQWIAAPAIQKQKTNSNIYNKFVAFADSQAKSKTLWYLVSMIAQGVFFLPIPAALIYYFNAPVIVIAITLTLFFANIIAGMGGESIRALLVLFALSIMTHLVMLAFFMI